MGILDASDKELLLLSNKKNLSLSLFEMLKIKKHYLKLQRNPTDLELETLAQTWSEHCVHKTFTSKVELNNGEWIDNLLKSTIFRVTNELNKDWCFSVFSDNAGIVDFDGDIAIAFKVETHNHPSSLEPFGGASTGVGGVIRDILGVWGDPIANTNVLCFGPIDLPYKQVPQGFKHPSFVFSYVTAGIGSYGNNIGIPTVNGSIFFDESYICNPIVFCGSVGLVKKSRYFTKVKPGDVPLLIGGKTGRDGIHGVTFASAILNENSEETSASAVQIGDPIEEEKIKRGIMLVRDLALATAITDLGGGGLSSAVGETAERSRCGCEIHLDRVSLKNPNMEPWEIWTSESQERMLISVPSENLERVIQIFEDEDVEAIPLGEFIRGTKLNIYYNGKIEGNLDIDFMFDNLKIKRKANILKPKFDIKPLKTKKEYNQDLISILSSPNVCSKESIIRTYDHEVKSITVLKPLQGIDCDGPGDAAVLKPLSNSWKGIAISNGINPEYGKIDPYRMAASAIDEAIRNNISVGGRRIALLDNFTWGNPENPDCMGSLTMAARACYDIALGLDTPFISGKDSLYNESNSGPVTPTLLISALGILPDVRKAISMDIKKAGNPIYIVGKTYEELGGSHYYKINNHLANNPPNVNPLRAKGSYDAIIDAIDHSLIKSCHDLSEGGLAVGAAEMAFAGGIGLDIKLKKVPKTDMREDHVMFSESNSRFIVEIDRKKANKFEEFMNGNVIACIGKTTKNKDLIIRGMSSNLIKSDLYTLKEAWQRTLR